MEHKKNGKRRDIESRTNLPLARLHGHHEKNIGKRCEFESRTNLPLAKLGGAAKVGGITTLFEPRGNCFKSFLNLEAFGVKSSSFGEPEVLFNASFTVRGDGAYAE